MVDVNVQGFNAREAAQSFGIRNSEASRVLEGRPVTSERFSNSNGDLEATADRISLTGGINQSVPEVTDDLALRPPTVISQIVQNTNPVSFAVQNSVEQPFERQGSLIDQSA